MIPILYTQNERDFSTNGHGFLTDARSCAVTREAQTWMYELAMEYPVGGLHYEYLLIERILMTNPGPGEDPQPFRIWKITRPIRGVCQVYARHVCYDLMGIVVQPFTANSIYEAASRLNDYQVGTKRFTFTDYTEGSGAFTLEVPTDAWTVLTALAEFYGCAVRFDRWSVEFVDRLGADRGVVLRDGKNMQTLDRDSSIQNAYTGVYPYWYKDEVLVDCRGYGINNSNGIIRLYNVAETRVLPLDLTEEFPEAPPQWKLAQAAIDYMNKNGLVGKVESHHIVPAFAEHEHVTLGDTVTVIQGQDTLQSTVVRTVCDCLLDRYRSVDVGSITRDVSATIAYQQRQIKAAAGGEKAARVERVVVGSSSGISYAGFGVITSSSDKSVRITVPMPAVMNGSYTFAFSGEAYLDSADGTNVVNPITTVSGSARPNGMGVYFDVTVENIPSGGTQLLRLPAGSFVTISQT